ncbi:hypothetical protein [Streptomyces sp. S186]|uniref:hypothetical protein n=1 Tax=Streptomyces sp. S186 TaxID=3434395 RepID=UPI003F67B3B7
MADMPPPPGLCVVDLFHGDRVPAETIVKGYMVCAKHLSFQEEFFRRWEAIQDPKQLKKQERKLLKSVQKTGGKSDVAP